jgi:hypothetical protein
VQQRWSSASIIARHAVPPTFVPRCKGGHATAHSHHGTRDFVAKNLERRARGSSRNANCTQYYSQRDKQRGLGTESLPTLPSQCRVSADSYRVKLSQRTVGRLMNGKAPVRSKQSLWHTPHALTRTFT